MSKQYSVRELRKLLNDNGYHCKRTSGSHAVYGKGSETITLPVVSLNYKIGNKIVNQLTRGHVICNCIQ